MIEGENVKEVQVQVLITEETKTEEIEIETEVQEEIDIGVPTTEEIDQDHTQSLGQDLLLVEEEMNEVIHHEKKIKSLSSFTSKRL